MFHDFIPMMLINMVAGLVLLAGYVYWGLERVEEKTWVPAFAIVGLVAFVSGLYMTFTWPAPSLATVNLQFANVAFGELTVLFGAIFLGLALALARHWRLHALAIYGFLGGVLSIVVGVRIGRLGLTQIPSLTAAGFILTGLGGVLILPLLGLKQNRTFRLVVALILLAAAIIWAATAFPAYWAHLERYSRVAS